MSTYTQNVPQANQKIRNTQSIINDNFNAIFDAVDRNHVTLNDTSNSGRHVLVEMEEQSSDPTPIATYATLYVKDDTGTQNLYMIDDDSLIHQFTNAFTAATSGEVIIPGGLILKWGNVANVTDDQAVVYPSPFTTSTFNVMISATRGDTTSRVIYVKTASLTASQFQVRTNSANLGMYWIAIGK